jgi:hypothetical protein
MNPIEVRVSSVRERANSPAGTTGVGALVLGLLLAH